MSQQVESCIIRAPISFYEGLRNFERWHSSWYAVDAAWQYNLFSPADMVIYYSRKAIPWEKELSSQNWARQQQLEKDRT